MSSIYKILVANRGEIALRIIRTCKELDIKTVAVYSEPDAEMPHVIQADESVLLGEAKAADSYLNMDKIIKAAHETGVDAIHPGYGFLSENAAFARRCREENIIFIGPSAESIQMMGDKTRARELMDNSGVPYPPGTPEAIEEVDKAEDFAEEIGFPVLIKAAAGGGGKGMRIVHKKQEFASSLRGAKSEARNAFGDDRVYIEKYLENPRHVEFQIIADQQGNVLHLFDRECSIQRRHQKVVEEAPCAILTPEMRRDMAEAAIAAARACDYVNAGTVEFMVDKDMNFYFLEMNTRLQVEHPVTELITGLDLVELQIRVAEGKELPLSQSEVQKTGHAIECRIYAEDPTDQFLPSTGTLQKHRVPVGGNVRIDSGVEEGQTISIDYDPMIAKLCTYGPDRQTALRRMKRALEEYEISGCRTTIPFCQFVMKHEAFREADYNTHFIQNYFDPQKINILRNDVPELHKSLAAALLKSEAGFRDTSDNGRQEGERELDLTDYASWWKNRKR